MIREIANMMPAPVGSLMHIDFDNCKVTYDNVFNEEVSYRYDRPEHMIPFRRAWYLSTTALMVKGSERVTVGIDGLEWKIVYTKHYAYEMIGVTGPKERFILSVRPVTPFHIKYMITEGVNHKESIRSLKMSEKSRRLWNQHSRAT